MTTNNEFELGGDGTSPKVESESVGGGSSSETRVDSASVDLIRSSKDFAQGVESLGRSVAESSMGSVSEEESVGDVHSRRAGDSNKLGVCESNEKGEFSDRNRGGMKLVKSEQQKGQRKKDGKSKESMSPVYDSMLSMFDDFAANGGVAKAGRQSVEGSTGHGFEVGDMVWGKVKSHPWWPGHVYSEEFANPSVRKSKREGLLLVAFFGDSSYGWFDPSELVPFDSNFAEKSRQTNSRTFVKAVEEAIDEVSRRSALGLSCMCRNKKNFRKTDVKGFFAVDVADYEAGAVYSIEAIGKARDSFQPNSALDFARQLALEPTSSEHAGIDFIKNKAVVMSYRKAIYEEFDETYAQAFGYPSVHPPPGSVQEPSSGKTPSKAPLSGRQVFADTSGKGKSPGKPNKPKDHAKKDKYLFKRRDEPKEVKTPQKEKSTVPFSPQPDDVEDPTEVAGGDYLLQKRASATQNQTGTTVTNNELSSRDTTEAGGSMEDVPIVLEFREPSKVEPPGSSSTVEPMPDQSGQPPKDRSVDDVKTVLPQTEDGNTSSGLVDDKSSTDSKVVVSGPKKMKVSKRPVGEVGSGKSALPDKKKKRKKESLTSNSQKDAVSAVNPPQSAPAPKPPTEDPHRTDNKPTTTSSSSHTAGPEEMTGLGNNEAELQRVLGDLHSLALDPFHAINKGWQVNMRKVFLRFRSLVFQKSLNLAEDDGNDTNPTKSLSENGAKVPLLKPQAGSSGRPHDPTTGGRKRGPSDRQEELAAKKKKKVGDIRNLTKEKKVIKKTEEPPARGHVIPLTKTGPTPMKKTSEPTMLTIKFPPSGYLPSINELKARFARYGPMDHSATRIFWNTFSCRMVYRHKIDAQAAYKFVMGSSSLFGNTDVKCILKVIGESEPPPKPPKEDHQPATDDRPTPQGAQPKSILKKPVADEAAGSVNNASRGTPRVKFMLGEDESDKTKVEKNTNTSSFSSSSSSDATMDVNSKNFHKTSNPLPLLPLPTSTNIINNITKTPPPPPPYSKHFNTAIAPPLPPGPPPRPLSNSGDMAVAPPLPPGNLRRAGDVDISNEMLSLLTKCNDVVRNVTSLLGYVPYHPL